ncbi:MAG TPA: PAS domain S-box protein [Chitinophagaceae bacterium]|nr:PAS domain S-box protein [Chitinophagaceae bacterium]
MPKNNFIDTQKLSSILIGSVIILSCLVLTGWQFDVSILKSIFPASGLMNPVAAILLIMAGLSLYCLQEDKQERIKNIGKYIALFIVLTASLQIIDRITQTGFGVDQLLFTKKLQGNAIVLDTLINFLLSGSSLLLINYKKKGNIIASQLLALFTFITSLLAITGYIYSTQFTYHTTLFFSMPLYTAIAFLLLSTGIIVSRGEKGFVSEFLRVNDGGEMVRRLLSAGIGIPVFIGFLRLEGQRLKLFDQEFGSALAIIIIISTLFIFIYWLARSLNKTDEKRKDAELRLMNVKDELSTNEIKYRNLIENSGVVMYTTSINGCITFSSSKAFQLTGYTMEELTGMHFTNLIDAENLEEVKGKYKRQVENKIEETLVEFCIRTKQGELKWVEQSAILVSEDEMPVGFQCTVKDISEKKIMEEVLTKYETELVQNQKRLQSVLDNTTSFIYIKDLDGSYLVTNKQFKETFNVNDDKVIGKTAFNFANPEQAKRFTDYDNEVIRTCKPVELEEIIEMPDGKHHFLIIKFPLLDAQNKIYGLSGIGTDITERVRYEEQLIQAKKIAEDAKKMQEQFLANMSHEIRTPMNGIQGMTDLLLETQLSEEQIDFTKTIKRSSDSLLVIINDILDFSKIQAGKLTIEKIDFKLVEVVENIKVIFRHRLQEKKLSFKFDIDQNVPSILNGDPYRLNQILVNLLGNAIKFTHDGGINIRVSIQKRSAEKAVLNFVITDTGIGIQPDKIKEIFESFTQASIETSRKYGGTGLGLAITKQLLELQGGSISAESEINTGTTFRFLIPYHYSNSNNSEVFKPQELKNNSALLNGKKFLIAEDNEINQKVIRHVLKKAGGLLDIANNGLEAISYLKRNPHYDLIIMDLQMPEMDGYEATKYIRSDMNLSIPIIAMTASALKGEKEKCLAIGMNDYLSKPFDVSYLYKRITELLNEQSTKPIIMETKTTTNENLFDLSLLQEMDDNEYIAEILTTYLGNTPGELKELKKICSDNQFDAIYKMAHKLKGSSGLLYAHGILRILSKIEEFAKAEIKEGLPVLAQQASDEFLKIEAPLKEILKNIQKESHVSI